MPFSDYLILSEVEGRTILVQASIGGVAKTAVDQLKTTGHVARGMIGVQIQNIDRAMAQSLGLPRSGGALVNNTPNNAVTFVNNNACVNTTSATAIIAPLAVTELVWFAAPATYTMGGKLLGFNVDPKFANALDGLILVDLTKTEPKLLERYLGTSAAAAFLEFQKGNYGTHEGIRCDKLGVAAHRCRDSLADAVFQILGG